MISNPSDVELFEGLTATLTVVAQGTDPLQYQWYKDGYAIHDGPNFCMTFNCHAIRGSTTAQLKIMGLNEKDCGSYFVVVKNKFGSIGSKTAVVRVLSFAFPVHYKIIQK